VICGLSGVGVVLMCSSNDLASSCPDSPCLDRSVCLSHFLPSAVYCSSKDLARVPSPMYSGSSTF
jgi:hypothetical protein